MKTQLYFFTVLFILHGILSQEHIPVLVGHFSPSQKQRLMALNGIDGNSQTSIQMNAINHVSRFASRQVSTGSSCTFDSDCLSGSCCQNVAGKTNGTCYNPGTHSCCARDGGLLPLSGVSNLQGECCSYTQSTGVFTFCNNTQASKCGLDTCVATCSSDASCGTGRTCCVAPASNNPSNGRCHLAAEICCFDGRLCDTGTCSGVGSGQCCGVNLESGDYTHCPAGRFCNIVSGALSCTSYAYGQAPATSTSTSGNSTGSAGGDASSSTTDSEYTGLLYNGENAQGGGSSSNLGLIIGIAIPCALVVIAITVLIVFLVIRRNNRKPRDVERIVQPTVPPQYKQSSAPMLFGEGSNTSGSIAPTGSNSYIVAPPYNAANGTYAAMEAATSPNIGGVHTAIDWTEIVTISDVGRGSFGEVFKAKWHEAFVAVKKIHPELLNDINAVSNFYAETEILKSLKPHPNTVLFFGITKAPLAILMEYCENGSLHQYLHSPAEITFTAKKNFLLGIARGMTHLHYYNVIHRDLAARNILLTSNFDVKVSDFGFSQVVPHMEKIRTPVGPVKWFPPEALKDNMFSSKTDVWSFGVVIWEVVTRQDPFEDKSVLEVFDGVSKQGLTLPVPADCPLILANLMRACFSQNPLDRPSFKDICTILEGALPQTVATA